MYSNISALNEMVKEKLTLVENVKTEIHKVIIGQDYMIERLLIGLFTNGHILLEGVPGLAKTLTIKTLADICDLSFQRIQFTPDMLPADLIGTMIYNQKEVSFEVKKGPIFANLILADEINRAPSKVQSALLEAMQEKQVTIGENTFKLPSPFLVLATQNPIEQEGTYPLPEAQVDRFMLKVIVSYPSKEEEKAILEKHGKIATDIKLQKILTPELIFEIRNVIDQIYIDDKVKDYIVDIVNATRYPEEYNLKELKNYIEFGASPRATINLILGAKAMAFLKGRGFATPQDVKDIGKDVLRHRIILSYEAEAEDLTSDDIINQLFDEIEVP